MMLSVTSPGSVSTLPARAVSRTGALVISLDFELHWGVRDLVPLNAGEQQRLIQARVIVPGLLKMFTRYGVRATWATVGALFAQSREHYLHHAPRVDGSAMAGAEDLGGSEQQDPYHFAPSLISQIRSCEGQEVGCHSFNHFTAMEAGQTLTHFAADLQSSRNIAAEAGIQLKSYIFPRNQVNEAYLRTLEHQQFATYRSNEPTALHASGSFATQRRWYKRAGRLADHYVNLCGDQTHELQPQRQGLVAVPSSRYLRPFMPALAFGEEFRERRIVRAMEGAAVQNRIFHLWWHPEDFASHPKRNLAFLERLLMHFRGLRDRYGMQSLSMLEAAATYGSAPCPD